MVNVSNITIYFARILAAFSERDYKSSLDYVMDIIKSPVLDAGKQHDIMNDTIINCKDLESTRIHCSHLQAFMLFQLYAGREHINVGFLKVSVLNRYAT